MQRPIEFKVWDVAKKRFHDPAKDYTDMFISLDGKLYERYCETMVGGNHIPASELFQLDPSKFIKVQFTGLHDKHGKPIYEGDIVQVRYNKEIVEFKTESNCGFYPFLGASKCCGCSSEMKSEECEIIGSIYETPELLEKKD